VRLAAWLMNDAGHFSSVSELTLNPMFSCEVSKRLKFSRTRGTSLIGMPQAIRSKIMASHIWIIFQMQGVLLHNIFFESDESLHGKIWITCAA